uniref:Phorbol-ester/DAG-type domain-containing protein n=1 Tax=Fagus sylvatica TaxID=28930 RepID=A0A2N9FQ28_FAGSY
MGKTHTSHPEHELELKNYRKPYTCDGCKGHGFGKRYRCEQCDYDLHEDCMFTTPTTSHKFFRNSTFKFYEQPPRNATSNIATIAKDIATHVGNTSKVSSTIARRLSRICTLVVATSRMN